MNRNPPWTIQKLFKCSCGVSFYNVVPSSKVAIICPKCRELCWAQKKEVPRKQAKWKEIKIKTPYCPMCGAKAVRLRANFLCTNGLCNYRAS